MKKLLLLALSFSLLLSPVEARKKKTQAGVENKAKPAAAAKTSEGLFTVTKNGANWFFEIPDSLIGRRFLVTVRYASTPANTGKYGGEMTNEQTVYWEQAPDNKLLLRA